jgi:hypothetical protein
MHLHHAKGRGLSLAGGTQSSTRRQTVHYDFASFKGLGVFGIGSPIGMGSPAVLEAGAVFGSPSGISYTFASQLGGRYSGRNLFGHVEASTFREHNKSRYSDAELALDAIYLLVCETRLLRRIAVEPNTLGNLYASI